MISLRSLCNSAKIAKLTMIRIFTLVVPKFTFRTKPQRKPFSLVFFIQKHFFSVLRDKCHFCNYSKFLVSYRNVHSILLQSHTYLLRDPLFYRCDKNDTRQVYYNKRRLIFGLLCNENTQHEFFLRPFI